MAYIDNFEHVETELDQRNATELKEQIEQMLRVELVGLIRDRADSESIDAKIGEINAKLDQATVIVPEFPIAALGILAAVIGVISILGKAKLVKR
jgi:flagellar motor component MotA